MMITAENLTKYYGEFAAVTDISFSIKEGEVVGLLGLNGAGKTTILRILSGLVLPTAGKVTLAGLDMAKNPEAVRAQIGFLPEQPPLYPEMSVCAYLEFVGHIKGLKGDIRPAIEAALQATDLLAVRDQTIGTLSHGFQRRVGIAQAIIHKPALILLDEPTAGLDPRQIVHMRELIRNLRGHNTILVSSHILREIHQMCDRIFVLQNGRIAAEGTEEDLGKKVAKATVLNIEVRAAAASLSKALSQMKTVATHTINHEVDGVTQARVELRSDAREDLAKTLVDAGFGIRRFERVQLELENIFLELTGHNEELRQ